MRQGITGSTLKIIAIIAMIIDHIGAVIVENTLVKYASEPEMYEMLLNVHRILRSVGRISFPIFCFLLVEGFLHTRNIGRYLLRLLLFAIVSEIPFDLAMSGEIFAWRYQNIFFTLTLGLTVIQCMDRILKQETWNKFARVCLCVLWVCIGSVAAEFLNVDYGMKGIIAIAALYLFRFNRYKQAIAGVVAFSWEFPASAAFLLLPAYNGQRGVNLKLAFYWVYPVHLLVLYLISLL